MMPDYTGIVKIEGLAVDHGSLCQFLDLDVRRIHLHDHFFESVFYRGSCLQNTQVCLSFHRNHSLKYPLFNICGVIAMNNNLEIVSVSVIHYSIYRMKINTRILTEVRYMAEKSYRPVIWAAFNMAKEVYAEEKEDAIRAAFNHFGRI